MQDPTSHAVELALGQSKPWYVRQLSFEQVREFSADMSAAYRAGIQEQFPQAA